MKYLLNVPYITGLEKKYITQVLESGWLSINGKNTKKFEKKFSNYLNRNSNFDHRFCSTKPIFIIQKKE